jgi:predicted permease
LALSLLTFYFTISPLFLNHHREDEPGRAAVLIASLPISMASFSLGSKYNTGEAVLSTNVAVGTVLMLPTVIIWNLVMDKIDLWTMY